MTTDSAIDQAKTRLSARFVLYPPIYPPNDLRVGLVMELPVGCSRVEPDFEIEGRGLLFRIVKPRPHRTPTP